MAFSRLGLGPIFLSLALGSVSFAQVVPHNQSAPPGPALTPNEAIAKMVVPDGFRVELVAGEPMVVNPVAMTFDEKGRIWVTESFEYPRREPGPGRDRVKVLEDTDGDGRADKVIVFAEGLNIPSGVAVGHGGVWVANSPDVLFYPDADRDGVADGPPQVVVSGFGRDDTHELPNSLTWGPDGWLYGWNGVFNPSKIVHRGKTYQFTCAIFRIHPRTRDFEVWSEGTSNPWGIAVNDRGDFFASACVIDHLWHMVEGAYYIRQGGPYPPFTWPMGSIVSHLHQKAAYCGIHYFDSPAYPELYRGRLYMGNIHGNGINVDTLKRDGSTYKAAPAPDFLAANDAWFMPVSQKTGPDGCLYILDWYDRYHCYQDANRDPAGIDRLKGRLYRVRYQDTPRRTGFDLARASDSDLLQRLHDPNVYDREIARRLLTERLVKTPALRETVQKAVMEAGPARRQLGALWTLIGSGPIDPPWHKSLLEHKDSDLRAWAVRAAGDQRHLDEGVKERLSSLAADPSPDVKLQLAVAATKTLAPAEAESVLVRLLAASPDDRLITHVVWQRLHPALGDPQTVARLSRQVGALADPVPASFHGLWPRLLDRVVAAPDVPGNAVADLARFGLERLGDPNTTKALLDTLTKAVREKRLQGDRLTGLRAGLEARVLSGAADGPTNLRLPFAQLAASWGNALALDQLRTILADAKADMNARVGALEVLSAMRDTPSQDFILQHLRDRTTPADFRVRLLGALGPYESPEIGKQLVAAYGVLDNDLRARAIELLTQRPSWSDALVGAVEAKQVPAAAVNVNHLRRLQAIKDPTLVGRVKALWGTAREGRNRQREEVVTQMRRYLGQTAGDPFNGKAVFTRVCGACHKLHGEGQDVGPDLTGNGRNDLEQLISNVFDPNLVIGAGFQATILATTDGRVLTGLLVEDTPQQVVLKLQGGKVETVPRADVDEMKLSEVSLMPEDLEKQLQPQEIADLFIYLGLDKPPTDPSAKRLPGLPDPKKAPSGR